MDKIGPIEAKILTISIFSAGLTGDHLISFLLPLASATMWVFIKPYVERYRRKLIVKKSKKSKK